MTLSRRGFLCGTTALVVAPPVWATGGDVPFSHDTVVTLARELSGQPHSPRAEVPKAWRDLSYEAYRHYWFRTADALWSGTDRPYEVDFFLPGLYFPRPVTIHEVTGGTARALPFDLTLFDRTDEAADLPVDDTLGYSGFRLRTELTTPGIKNEFCVFQGASYFRALGMAQVYGLSARGLALHTADERGEEFPEFTQFWIEAPAPGQRVIVVHALLESPSVTGAYRFAITPGPACVMEVEATLFPREDLTHVGLGPLTSMFLYDETNRTRFDDFRPAVHDSDGLMIWNGAGEVLWRPLANPTRLQVSSFLDDSPRGFGLMQRARELEDFADLEALYHARPGLWVEPKGDWGKGAVTLVEIPADKEIYDNIVAYWRPAEPIQAGTETKISYRLTWGATAPVETGLPSVVNTRMGARETGGRIVTVDFEAHDLLDEGPEGIEAVIHSPHVTPSPGVIQRNPATGGLRVAFNFDPGERELVELRAQLFKDGQPASEVWLYRWTA
ncbi:glucan biosynthesis protein [Roseovarius aestuariivivens]|uniref:glucan biosynthesis protein n=1 Tax=Roseovarius aestuariivivens TaxID=1888910 RepID=UPI00107FEBCE|nr:glucan biosynthesis protein G [Roseovarius aestuariivivens]